MISLPPTPEVENNKKKNQTKIEHDLNRWSREMTNFGQPMVSLWDESPFFCFFFYRDLIFAFFPVR